jgi:ribose transport system permease protein
MKRLFEQPWIWALLGVVGLWILLSIGTGQVNLGNLTGIVASAALLCVVAIGQMLVVTTGNGAIDLSIPSVITLSAFVLTSVTNGQDSRLALGLVVVAAIGALVGWVNALIVNGLRIPPIIATLAVGYILTTATLIYNRGFTTYAVSPLLAYAASGRVFGIPLILILALRGRSEPARCPLCRDTGRADNAHRLRAQRRAGGDRGSLAIRPGEWRLSGDG